MPSTLDAARVDLFSPENELQSKYNDILVNRLLRLRDMYSWYLANPESKDKVFVDTVMERYGIHKVEAYDDLKIVKAVLPNLTQSSRDFHRWRYNEMILETYKMAKARKDTKTMEKSATSYAKFNRVDLEDEQAVPYDQIVVQPFTATSDPTVLGIKPMPNLHEKIKSLIEKYSAETLDIEDVEYEEVDLEEQELFGEVTGEGENFNTEWE